MASKSDVMAGGAFVRLFLKDDLSKSLSGALKSAGSALSSFGSNAKAMGGAMMAGGAAIAAPLAGALVVGANFQDIMLDIAASTGVTSDELARLNEAAMNAKVGPAAAAESFLELLKAGISLEEVLGGAGQAAIAFAKVGKMETEEAAVVMADAMKVFGVSADTAANTISAAADASSTDIQGMSQAFANVGAVASMANQNITDTSAALAILASEGIKGAEGGTALKTALLRLMVATDGSGEGMEMLGLSFRDMRDGAGNMLPIVDIIRKLEGATAGMNAEARDQALFKLFGSYGLKAGVNLLKSGSSGFLAMRDGMAAALPVSKKFSIMMSGLTGMSERFWASAQRIAITISDALQPVLAAIAPHIERAAVWFGEFAKNNTWLGPALAATAVALTTAGTALVAIGVGATALASVVTALGTLVSFAPMLPPIAAALVGIAAGLAVLKGLDMAGILDFGRVLEAAKSTGEYLQGIFMPMLGTIKDAFTTAWSGISTAIQAGDWQAAGEIAMAGLEVAVAAGLLAMRTMWEDYRQAVLDTILGTARIAVDTLAALSKLGGPFAGLIGGGLAAGASKILDDAGKSSRQGGADRINAARQAQTDAKLKLREKVQKANEFVEEVPGPEEFVEDIPQPQDLSPADIEAVLQDWFDQREAEDTMGGYLQYMADVPDFTQEPEPVEISEEQRAQIFDGASPIPQGVGSNLTTYNAAAAQAAGFMGGGSPIEKMTTSIYQMAEDLKELGLLSKDQKVSNQQVVTMYERFLAAFTYA